MHGPFYCYWLPLVDALRDQFARPSKEVTDTIFVAKMQLNDGFLSAGEC